jgi:hypothetical protein
MYFSLYLTVSEKFRLSSPPGVDIKDIRNFPKFPVTPSTSPEKPSSSDCDVDERIDSSSVGPECPLHCGLSDLSESNAEDGHSGIEARLPRRSWDEGYLPPYFTAAKADPEGYKRLKTVLDHPDYLRPPMFIKDRSERHTVAEKLIDSIHHQVLHF